MREMQPPDLKEMHMGWFMSGKRTGCVAQKTEVVLCAVSVSMLFVCCMVVFSGCKRRKAPETVAAPALEAVHTNRMDDPVYRQALSDNRVEQARIASERSVVVSRMEKLVVEARAGLPEGADDEAVKAELEKRPEWKVLEEENARKIAGIEKTLAAARETVRQRIETEARDVKAVAEGKAVPAQAERDGNKR